MLQDTKDIMKEKRKHRVRGKGLLFYTSVGTIVEEAGQVSWYTHLLKNFPQFFVIYTVKGFGIVNKADVFLELSCFSMIQWMLAILWDRGLHFCFPTSLSVSERPMVTYTVTSQGE